MQFKYDRKLSQLLLDIGKSLLALTPAAVAKLKVAEPAYALFLWYDDSSACGDVAPDFGVGVESLRAACAEEYDDRASVNDCIWRPGQCMEHLLIKGQYQDTGLTAKCNQAYALMWAANQTGSPLGEEDDAELLRPFRAMMQRVALLLNEHNWQGVLKTTDDFVVVASDRIGYWLLEDLKSSLPKAKFELLRTGGRLFE